jgi:hypothetical protein
MKQWLEKKKEDIIRVGYPRSLETLHAIEHLLLHFIVHRLLSNASTPHTPNR